MDTPTGLVLASLITAVGGFTTLIVTQHFQARTARRDREQAQREREQVKVDVVTAAEKVADVVKGESASTTAKLKEIHLLVNSRLTAALNEIKALRKQLGKTEAKVEEVKRSPRVRK